MQLHTEVKASSVLHYACDEPTLPPYITLTVKGAGSSEVTADMNFFREYNKLYYENFIYIAATHTFSQYVAPYSLLQSEKNLRLIKSPFVETGLLRTERSIW